MSDLIVDRHFAQQIILLSLHEQINLCIFPGNKSRG